jgi:hypothetical protein
MKRLLLTNTLHYLVDPIVLTVAAVLKYHVNFIPQVWYSWEEAALVWTLDLSWFLILVKVKLFIEVGLWILELALLLWLLLLLRGLWVVVAETLTCYTYYVCVTTSYSIGISHILDSLSIGWLLNTVTKTSSHEHKLTIGWLLIQYLISHYQVRHAS